MTAITECLGSAWRGGELVNTEEVERGDSVFCLSGVAPLAHAASQPSPSPAATTTGQPGQPMQNHSCCNNEKCGGKCADSSATRLSSGAGKSAPLILIQGPLPLSRGSVLQ